MRNNPRPDQLAISVLLVSALTVALPHLPAALLVPAGLALLTLPGYWWSQVVLPALGARSAERIFASLLLTIAIVIIAALVMYGLGVRLTNVAWSAALTAVGLAGWWTAGRVGARPPVGDPASPRPRVPRRRDIVLLVLAAIVLAGTAILARTPLSPPPGTQGYSQLWLVPAASGFQLGVASFELHPTHYRVELAADGAVIQQWDDVFLAPGQQFTENVAPSGALIEARLYLKDSGSADPYRRVHIGVATSTTAPP